MLREVISKLLKSKAKETAPPQKEGAAVAVESLKTDPNSLPQAEQTQTKRTLRIKVDDVVENKVNPLLKSDFDPSRCELTPMDGLIIKNPVNPQKKPWWRILITDIFNGIVTTMLLLLFAGLLAESYLQHPYPYTAWIAFIPFTIAILNIRNIFAAFAFSQAAGTIFYLAVLYWIFPTVQFGTDNIALAGAGVLALSLILGVQFALFGSACFYLKRIKWLFPIAAAAAWVAFEFLHQLIAYKSLGFPWFALGYTQFENLQLIQISTITGVYGVSFLVAFFGLSFGLIASIKNRAMRITYFVLPLALLSGAFFFGASAIKAQEGFAYSKPQTLSVALIQPNTHMRMVRGEEEDVFFIIAEQVEPLKEKKLDLIVWPESSLAGSFTDEIYGNFIRELSAKTGASQITGSYYIEDGSEYVSAALFDQNGIVDVYNKIKLVPFGEFLPFYGLLKTLYTKNNITTFTGDFKEGETPSKTLPFTLPPPAETLLKAQKFAIGTNICFESIFPAVWRAQALNGAQFFVNITNDGWFLDTAAPYQHLRVNVLRAVETRRPILRVANTGISAWVDSIGKIRFQTQAHKQETALFDFTFQPRTSKTFYTINGDIFSYACALLALTLTVFAIAFRGLKNG